jgi:hypothetical protein
MTTPSPISEQSPSDHPEARRLRREQRLADPSRGGTWVVGIVLIVLGGMFLMRSTGLDISLTNWWALFILIPAIGAISASWRIYCDAGNRLTNAAHSSLLVGLDLTFITFMFLFEISRTYVGAILIIVVGIAIILNYAIGSQE